MILLPFLLLSGISVFIVAISHLNQKINNYYDFVAMTMVLGGTLIVGMVLVPWEYRREILHTLRLVARPESRKYKQVMGSCFSVLTTRKYEREQAATNHWLYQNILQTGIELIQLSLPIEKIESILSEKVYHSVKRWKKIGNAVKNLSKYPPAFGLMGTVLGLVNTMKSLAGASEASSLGVEMSIALVSTMYGLIVANFLVNPIGELIIKKADEEEEYAELALQAILLTKEEASLVESTELLNAMVPDDQRQGIEQIIHFEEKAA